LKTSIEINRTPNDIFSTPNLAIIIIIMTQKLFDKTARTLGFSWITKRQKQQKLFDTWNWENKNVSVSAWVCVRERACAIWEGLDPPLVFSWEREASHQEKSWGNSLRTFSHTPLIGVTSTDRIYQRPLLFIIRNYITFFIRYVRPGQRPAHGPHTARQAP